MSDMRLIDADKLKRILYNIANTMQDNGYFSYAGALGEAANIVDKQPTIDAVQVVRARWVYDRPHHYKCSACKSMWGEMMKRVAHFCPNCGAKMDGGAEG
jgi:predicted RNA-binding Zn-ribbon protein involved in translation (DUF1610 family)